MNLRGFLDWMAERGPDDQATARAAIPWVMGVAVICAVLFGGAVAWIFAS